MPRSFLAALLALLALVCALTSLGFAPRALAEGGGHGTEGFIVLDQLEVEQRQKARRLFAEIVCKCPNENWSKSLLNCPDGCADPQKQEILNQIVADWSVEKIIDYQVKSYGPRAHGKPDDTLTYLLPVLALIGAALVVGVVFIRWRRSAAEARVNRRSAEPPEESELAAIERELQELR